MDDHMSWVTSWEQWRKVMGASGSRQRRNVDDFLETHPAILYWGDSWFSTPLYLNLARQSARRINGLSMIVGKPGALAANLFSPSEVERVGGRIEANPFDVVCLSAGGNDCLSDRLTSAFRKWTARPGTSPKISAADAYQVFLSSGLLSRVSSAYVRVLDNLSQLQKSRPHLRVVGHCYLPIVDIGKPADLKASNIGLIAWVKDDVGPWLWEPMQHVLPSKREGQAFARLILESGFRDSVLKPLAVRYDGLFSYVDFAQADTTFPGFWNDEIHPGEVGFEVLSRVLNKEIRNVLPAGKRGAVT